MTLIDTNLLIRAIEGKDAAALKVIHRAVMNGEAVTSVISVTEMQVGAADPKTVAPDILGMGVGIASLPLSATVPTARAFASYLKRRATDKAKLSKQPMPDFFIGGHAEAKGWTIATDDEARFKTYFPRVPRIVP